MAHEMQPTDGGQEQQSSLPAHSHPEHLGVRLAYFGYTAIPSVILLDIMTQGQLGESAAVAAFLGGAACYWAPHLHKALEPGLRAAGNVWDYLNRNNSGRAKSRLLNKNWWLGQDLTVYADEEEPEADEDQAELLEGEPETDDSEHTPELDTANVQPSPIPDQFGLGGQTLEAIREVNQKRFVYFGRTATREVVINVDDMYHVLDIASSGKGKSNRFRLAMMQVVDLAETYYINPLANSVKAVNDSRRIEVWQPIFDRLANKRPIKEGPEILQLMRALCAEIQTRVQQEAARDFSWSGQPVFVFIDELPEVFARCPEAIDLLDKIGRTGRQFHIFCWVASQTALVDDIGLSTASQGQFKTRIYGGGDKTSADRVMKGSVTRANETILQTSKAGLSLMLADGFSSSEFVRAPLVSNEALFAYFGLPPFRREEWLSPRNESQQPVRRVVNLMETDLSPSTPSPNYAHNAVESDGERVKDEVKGERRERVKGPNEEAILDALNALEEERKPLTLNALAKKAGLTWHQYDEIEMVAAWSGYDLDRGRGRPAKEG